MEEYIWGIQCKNSRISLLSFQADLWSSLIYRGTYPRAEDEGEDYIDYGAATLSFYSSLVDLLGKCAPEAVSKETVLYPTWPPITHFLIIVAFIATIFVGGFLG